MAATNADLKIHMARRHWDIEGLDILNNLPKTYKKEWKCNKCDLVFHDYSVRNILVFFYYKKQTYLLGFSKSYL
jgi:hypothetical protein